MFEFIKNTYKKGDKLKLSCTNGEYAGEVLFIGKDSIIIKDFDGKTCGIKGCDISFFETVAEETQNVADDLKNNSVSTSDKSETSDTEFISAERSENIEEVQNNVNQQSELQAKIPQTSKYKVGDVIPLEELERINSQSTRPKKTKFKPTQTFKGLDSLKVLVEEEHKIQNEKFVPALGIIDRVFADRQFGFILDGQTGKKVWFAFYQIIDENINKSSASLYKLPVVYSVQNSERGEKAITIHRPGKIHELILLAEKLSTRGDFIHAVNVLDHILAEYPDNFDADELKAKIAKFYPQIHIKKNSKLYNQAKKYNLAKDYPKAIEFFIKAINAKEKLESSIKDLGMLYAQLHKQSGFNSEYREMAIKLMSEHKGDLPHSISTLYYLENLYYSIQDYEDFIESARELLEENELQQDKVRSAQLLCKIAAAYVQINRIDDALTTIEEALSFDPKSIGAQKLRMAIESENKDVILDAISDTQFESLNSGLSPFIQQTLSEYEEYAGIKEKIIDSENFKINTLRQIRHLIENTIGRSKERAKYILTEVKLMQDIEPDESKLRSELARYCNDMAKSSMFDQRPIDVIRYYYYEAFSLEDRIDQTLRQVVLFLCSFYMSHRDLLNSRANNVDKEGLYHEFDLSLNKAIDQPHFWEELLNILMANTAITSFVSEKMFLNKSYREKAFAYLNTIGIYDSENTRESFAKAWERARDARKNAYNSILAFIKSWGDYARLEECITNITQIELEEQQSKCLCSLDKKRIHIIKINIIPALQTYINSSGYKNKEVNRNNANGQLSQLVEDIKENPTKVSFEGLLPFLEVLCNLLDISFNDVIKTSEPRVDVKLLSEETVVDDQNLVSIQVSVSNHKDSSPIREVSVVIQDMPGISFIADNNVSYNAIDGGDSFILKLKLKIDDEIRRLKATSLKAVCKYRSGAEMLEKTFDLSLKLYSPSDFSKIDNPYSPVADGGPVPVTSNMFYGRDVFISDVAKSILNSPSKQIIIYGQKRCGKSSVMLHLKEKLMETKRMFCVFFSMGDIINKLNEASFYYKILSSIKNEIEIIDFDGGVIPEFEIPNYSDFKKEDKDNPLNTFTKYMIKFKLSCKNTEGWQEKNLVVMIDEFTYLYTEIKKGNISPSIMKQWKAVTQNPDAQFSVVLVGQDVVPSFKKEEYASNAFGVIQDIRLTYLDEQPARELIEKPILETNGESRYIGNAVTRILDYTSRNPYYIQIFCARLVDYMNRNKSIKVTEADVNEVAHSFVIGDQALDIGKFDNLIRAGESEDLQEVPEAEIIAVLKQIAIGTKNITYCKRADISTDYGEEEENIVLQHLIDREVLEKKGNDNYKIQVKLFQEWLLNH